MVADGDKQSVTGSETLSRCHSGGRLTVRGCDYLCGILVPSHSVPLSVLTCTPASGILHEPRVAFVASVLSFGLLPWPDSLRCNYLSSQQ